MKKADLLFASILATAAAALPDTTPVQPRTNYGDVKPVKVQLNYRPGRKKGRKHGR